LAGSQEPNPSHKNLPSAMPKYLLWKVFGGSGLTWSNLWKNRPVKQKLKAVVTVLSCYFYLC